MAHVDIAELHERLPDWLARARGGEELVVTDHGATIARIVPPGLSREDARRALAALRAGARVGDVEFPVVEAWDVTVESHRGPTAGLATPASAWEMVPGDTRAHLATS